MVRTSHTVDDGRHILHSLERLRQTTMLPLTFGGPVTASRQVVLSEFCGPNIGAMKPAWPWGGPTPRSAPTSICMPRP